MDINRHIPKLLKGSINTGKVNLPKKSLLAGNHEKLDMTYVAFIIIAARGSN